MIDGGGFQRVRRAPAPVRMSFALLAAVIAAALAMAGTAKATHVSPSTSGHTTLEQRFLSADQPGAFRPLTLGPGEPHVVREEGIASAAAGRVSRRRSLAYFGQFTDFQLADEESPARVEFADEGANSAWRPHEAFHPFAIDYAIRQMNHFVDGSPVAQGDGTRARMRFAALTGDNSDNMQLNETVWVRQLIDGESTNPNSGTSNYSTCSLEARAALALRPPNEAQLYTGVQDYDDYSEHPQFYDPDRPLGTWQDRGWPTFPGLMDRAQTSFQPAGLRVPAYVANGNHDGLVQGNEDANREFEQIAIGCRKVFATSGTVTGGEPDPNLLLQPPAGEMFVPPDERRQFVDKRQLKAVYSAKPRDDDHGFAHVDPAENTASNGSASYYAWDPVKGVRFIALDTLSEGGVVERSSNGNIDDPQWRWLERELQRATADGKVIVVLGHHPVRSLTADVPDEAAPPCTGQNDPHGHDHNPGCDIDTRVSAPIHLGMAANGVPGLVELFEAHPNVIAYVAGHTHENKVTPFRRSSGGGWWGIETSAQADWPQQNRLIEVMDNRDGTLSIFGTLIDSEAPAEIPPSGTVGALFGEDDLAAVGRAFAFNDPQIGSPVGEGATGDRNVELLVRDPRPRGGPRR